MSDTKDNQPGDTPQYKHGLPASMTDHGDPKAAAAVHEKFPDVTCVAEFRGDVRVHVEPAHEVEVIRWARDELGFDMFIDRMGADHGEDKDPRFDVITLVYNLKTDKRLIFITTLPEEDPITPTLIGVYRGAEWFEREAGLSREAAEQLATWLAEGRVAPDEPVQVRI